MFRRTKPRRIIRRRISVKINGRVVKTTRDRITIRQATREVGEDVWYTKGDVKRFTRRAGCVSISFEYTAADDLLGNQAMLYELDTPAAVAIVRAGIPM